MQNQVNMTEIIFNGESFFTCHTCRRKFRYNFELFAHYVSFHIKHHQGRSVICKKGLSNIYDAAYQRGKCVAAPILFPNQAAAGKVLENRIYAIPITTASGTYIGSYIGRATAQIVDVRETAKESSVNVHNFLQHRKVCQNLGACRTCLRPTVCTSLMLHYDAKHIIHFGLAYSVPISCSLNRCAGLKGYIRLYVPGTIGIIRTLNGIEVFRNFHDVIVNTVTNSIVT